MPHLSRFLQLHNFKNVAYVSYMCLLYVAISVFFYAKIKLEREVM